MTKRKKSRNLFAISAQFRNSAGAFLDRKKEELKNLSRKLHNKNELRKLVDGDDQ